MTPEERDHIRRLVERKMDFMVQTFFSSTLEMSGAEMGLYLLTLNYAWTNSARLPADADRLRRTLRFDKDEWSKLWSVIVLKWEKDGAWLKNRKLTSLYAAAWERTEIAVRKGAEGGRAKAASREISGRATAPSANVSGPPLRDPTRDPTPPALAERDIEPVPPMSGGVPNSTVCSPVASAFDAFWAAYPRKVGKAKALAVFSKLKPPQRQKAVMGVVTFASAWKGARPDRVQFIPHPSTWLGQGRFDDDPTEWSKQANGANGAAGPPVDPVASAKEREAANAKALAEAREKMRRQGLHPDG